MKKIGYIYKFSALEKKGILVYGFNQAPCWQSPRPILFTSDDCLSKIESGQLVYFDLKDSFAKNIESATLNNFKRDIIEEIVSCYDYSKDKLPDDCKKATSIRYEDISKIYIRVNKEDDRIVENVAKEVEKENLDISTNTYSENNNNEENEDEFDFDIDWDDIFDDEDDDYLLFDEFNNKYRYEKIAIPESIEDIYNIFANHNHGQDHSYDLQSDFIDVDILDLNLWINPQIAKSHNCYGKTGVEIKDIFELFIDKRYKYFSNWASRYNHRQDIVQQKFPTSFRLLIYKMDDANLKFLCENLLETQHLLPESFCMNNINLLSNLGLFPTKKTGEKFLESKIKSIETIKEYSYWSHYLEQCLLYRFKHKKGEGISLHEINKTCIKEIIANLENRFTNHIINGLKIKISNLSHKTINAEKLISELDLKRINQIGFFVEEINEVSKSDWYFAKDDYLCMNNEDKSLFKPILQDYLIEYSSQIIKNGEVDKICFLLDELKEWIEEKTINAIKRICIKELENIKELEQLKDARNNDLIDDSIYLKQFKNITKDYSEKDFINLIDKQSYLLPKIAEIQIAYILIFQYGGGTISTYNNYINSIRHKFSYGTIPTGFEKVEDIVKMEWYYKEELKGRNIKSDPLVKIVSNLNKADRIKLFEENFYLDDILSKSEIREYISGIYSHSYMLGKDFKSVFVDKEEIDAIEKEKNIIGKQCIQDEIIADLCKDKIDIPYEDIIECLNLSSLKYVQQNGNEFIKFYLWAKSPDDNLNWSDIEKYFTKLSTSKQCSLFRFFFYLHESNKIKINIEDLYSKISKNGEVCDIIYNIYIILKKKLKSYKSSISTKDIKGDNVGDFLFYCKGNILKSSVDDYYNRPQSGEVNLISKDNNKYYEIQFYANGITESFLKKRIEIFERNFVFEKVKDKTYIVSIKYKYKLKQFVLNHLLYDRCNLFREKINEHEDVKHDSLIKSYGRKYCQGYYKGTDHKYKLPFVWCKKSPCVNNYQFFKGISNWKEFKLSDLLYILGKNNQNIVKNIWKITAEISYFFNNRTTKVWVFDSPYNPFDEAKAIIPKAKTIQGLEQSCPIKKEEEVSKWDKSLSTVVDEHSDAWYDDNNPNEDDIYDNFNPNSYDSPTYDRYRGSYAQDEMGYSDDDIDTIFDGDPSAYWNID